MHISVVGHVESREINNSSLANPSLTALKNKCQKMAKVCDHNNVSCFTLEIMQSTEAKCRLLVRNKTHLLLSYRFTININLSEGCPG